jgi:hypothetical protein
MISLGLCDRFEKDHSVVLQYTIKTHPLMLSLGLCNRFEKRPFGSITVHHKDSSANVIIRFMQSLLKKTIR